MHSIVVCIEFGVEQD